MTIEQGLFQFDLTDYHAILGVPLDADAKQIRKRYLKIARKLHPDSLRSSTDEEKQTANQLLSKFVNPAYEKLMQEKTLTEHQVVLRLRGQQLSREKSTVVLQSQTAQEVLGSSNALALYNSGLSKLTEEQYEVLDNVLKVIGEISELNLAYLVSHSESAGSGAAATAAPSATKAATPSAPGTPTAAAASRPAPSPRRPQESILDRYLNRARQLAAKKEYSRAILEMREAVKSHPNSAQCHSQLSQYYLLSGQATMAKIHLKRALEIEPENALGKQLEGRVNKAQKAKAAEASSKSAAPKSKGGKGGLFGLFGGKQK